MIKPTKDRILAKEVRDWKETGMIVLPETNHVSKNLTVCEVLDLGPKYKDGEVKIGSMLLVDKHQGADLKHNGIDYRLLRPYQDVLAVLC